MIYKSKPKFINAVQWNKPGDHPDVLFEKPDEMGNICGEVALPGEWAWVDPGDYLLIDDERVVAVISKEEFESEWEMLEEKEERSSHDC